ncbi:hypothetical protein L585_08520 [Pantoea ananatis BRT175]|nr:hypothetical protein L585_08520 [Pantoea ananatis BRT175]
MNALNDVVRKLSTRIAGLLGVGRITGLDDSGVVQKVQYQTPLEAASATRMAEFGFTSGLPVGTDVILGFLGGDRSNPVVIASGHQTFRLVGLNPGESAMYNQWGLFVRLTEQGIEIEAKGQDVTVSNARKLTATATDSVRLNTPVLYVTGDVVDNCDTNSVSVKALRDKYNDHSHQIKNVQGGSSTLSTEKTGEPAS